MLTRFSMLENFLSYLNEFFEKRLPSILEELINVEYYKAKGRPSYSMRVIRYALLQRYTSAASYRLMLQHFSLPSFQLLYKINSEGLEFLSAVKLLHKSCLISTDIILMADDSEWTKSGKKYF